MKRTDLDNIKRDLWAATDYAKTELRRAEVLLLWADYAKSAKDKDEEVWRTWEARVAMQRARLALEQAQDEASYKDWGPNTPWLDHENGKLDLWTEVRRSWRKRR
jgi:hypothetical protein